MNIRSSFLALILLAITPSPLLQAAPQMAARETPEGILILEDGSPVLHYQKAAKSKNGLYKRANYIHPLYNLDGKIITEDFPDDHLHQRGIFWTWHQVREGDTSLGDGWECRDMEWDVVSAGTTNLAEGGIMLKTRVLWKSPKRVDQDGEMDPFVEENAEITVYPQEAGQRIIDFKISLRALADNILIGGSDDEKGYGGFSLRVLLPEDVSFRGLAGKVEPRNRAVSAGPALDVMGSYSEGAKSGIAVIQHPSNPGFIQAWILRYRDSMQNPVYPGRNPVRISRSGETTLRYRLVLHGPGTPDIESMFREFSELN